MAYETYTTEAIVCGRFLEREHDVTLRLFTERGGMLYARAGGVRAGKSKLRYALQDFSYVRVTLVRGKVDWRVTGAVALENFYFTASSRNARAVLLLAMRSVRRLIHGSDPHPHLFQVVVDGLRTLSTRHDSHAERIFLLRLLHHLGYVSPQPQYAAALHMPTLAEACAHLEAQGVPNHIGLVIENALAASHL